MKIDCQACKAFNAFRTFGLEKSFKASLLFTKSISKPKVAMRKVIPEKTKIATSVINTNLISCNQEEAAFEWWI